MVTRADLAIANLKDPREVVARVAVRDALCLDAVADVVSAIVATLCESCDALVAEELRYRASCLETARGAMVRALGPELNRVPLDVDAVLARLLAAPPVGALVPATTQTPLPRAEALERAKQLDKQPWTSGYWNYAVDQVDGFEVDGTHARDFAWPYQHLLNNTVQIPEGLLAALRKEPTKDNITDAAYNWFWEDDMSVEGDDAEETDEEGEGDEDDA